MKIVIKQLLADVLKVRDSLPINNPQWMALNDIAIDLSFFPDEAAIVVEDEKKDKQKETKTN